MRYPNLFLVLAAIVIAALGSAVLFCAFAFGCWASNPGEWSDPTRALCALLWVLWLSTVVFAWSQVDRSRL